VRVLPASSRKHLAIKSSFSLPKREYVFSVGFQECGFQAVVETPWPAQFRLPQHVPGV